MLAIIKRIVEGANKLDEKKYSPCYSILANTDSTSESKINLCSNPLILNSKFLTIQRSREVNQPWMQTVYYSIIALFNSIYMVWKYEPALILCNGPGTCVPLCFAIVILRILGIACFSTKIVFVESFCRVQSLSLSGKLLYPISDIFVVQWPDLAIKHPKAQYLGVIC